MPYADITKKRASNKRYRDRVNADPKLKAKKKEYFQAYHRANPHRAKYKAYRSFDKKRGFTNDLETSWAYDRMQMSCYYCGALEANGLDRKNSNIGHTKRNTVTCCEKCNMILGDIPFKVKELLASGLRDAEDLGLLDDWVPPTKRYRK